LSRSLLFKTVAVLLILIRLSLAQTDDKQMFAKGINFYKQKQYKDAQRTFFLTLKNYPNSRMQTVIKLMLAKSYYKIGDYSTAELVIGDFLRKYDFSDYLDDIYFLKGQIDFREENYQRAVEDWLWIVYNGSDTRLKKKAGRYVFNTMEIHLSEREIVNLGKKYSDDTFVGLVEIVQAQKLINAGQRVQGERRLERFIEQYPYHLYADVANEILRGIRGGSIKSNSIIIMKSGEEDKREVSDAIVKGVMYAAYEMSQRNREKSVTIDTITVSSDVLSTVRQALITLETRQPLALVGPLDDDKNTALALLSRYEFFPYIAPISSQNGLAQLSPYTFQINPDAEIKGRFLADYAVTELDFQTFIILAPADDYGISMVRGFEETIQEYEREIVDIQWYYDGTEDFSRQLKAIRKLGFFITFRDSVLSADSTLAIEEIQEQFQQYMTDVLFSNQGNREIDSTQVPSTGVDALLIVTYPEYVPFIAPQFAFQNIQTTLLGNEGWNNKSLLMQHRVYLDGLIYISAGYFEPESWNYRTFLSRFRQQMQETPGIYHLLGYDIGKWMISLYQPGISRRDFREALADERLYEGILENIKFGIKPRVNSELNVIRFYRGQLLKEK
jgi:ABC-type branched-subunit amino acid transport system substrate-binding protein